jgi:hypothetical protein
MMGAIVVAHHSPSFPAPAVVGLCHVGWVDGAQE